MSVVPVADALRRHIARVMTDLAPEELALTLTAGLRNDEVTSFLDRRAVAELAIRASRRLGCLISPARASSVSRSPYSPISCAAR